MPEHTPAPTASRAYYGFAMYLTFKICFILYVTYALVPEHYWKSIGITCLPQRYWAIAIPIFLLTVLTMFAFILYPSLGLCMTPNVNDFRTIRDTIGSKIRNNPSTELGTTNKMVKQEEVQCSCLHEDGCFKQNFHGCESKSIPAVKDLNIWDVSKELYLN